MKKKNLVFAWVLMALLAVVIIVLAAHAWDEGIHVPAANTNYSDILSGTLHLNASYENASTVTDALNATFWYNASGTWTYIINGTCVSAATVNASCDVIKNLTNITDGTWTINVTFENFTGGQVSLSAGNLTENVTIDTTPPNVTQSSFTNPKNGTNNTGTVVINVSIREDTTSVSLAYINVTKGTDDTWNGTYTLVRSGTTNDYTVELNTSDFADGEYNLTVYVNDSVNNLNNTALVTNITFDSTKPTVTLTRESETKTSINMNISVTDGLSGPKLASCTVDRTGATVSGTGATQTMIEKKLSCSTTYTYVVTCRDRAGNSASDTESFKTDPCGGNAVGGSSSSGGGSTVAWESTHVVTSEQLKEGFTKELVSKDRLKVKVGVETHYVGVVESTENTAVIEVSSNPVEATLNVGDTKKFDVTGDGYYDLSITLESIKAEKVSVALKSIREKVTEATEAEQNVAQEDSIIEDKDNEKRGPTSGSSNLAWLWILIAVVVVVAVGYVIKTKKKK